MPLAGAMVSLTGMAGTRRFPIGNYLVYYRPVRGRILIWRVIHGSRRQSKALGKS